MFVNFYIEVKDKADSIAMEFLLHDSGYNFIDAGTPRWMENATLEDVEAAVCKHCRKRRKKKD